MRKTTERTSMGKINIQHAQAEARWVRNLRNKKKKKGPTGSSYFKKPKS